MRTVLTGSNSVESGPTYLFPAERRLKASMFIKAHDDHRTGHADMGLAGSEPLGRSGWSWCHRDQSRCDPLLLIACVLTVSTLHRSRSLVRIQPNRCRTGEVECHIHVTLCHPGRHRAATMGTPVRLRNCGSVELGPLTTREARG